MPKSTIRNLLFDLGNVIIDIDIPGTHDRIQALLQPGSDLSSIEKGLLDYECGKISTDIFINSILRHAHRDVQALDVIEAWNSMLIGIPSYRLVMLETLRSKYNVYLLSNTNALHLEWVHHYVNKYFGVRDFEKQFFDETFYSHLIGDRKPNPSIFKYVQQEGLITPDVTLFMDDMADNLSAASMSGFRTYLVKPGEEIAEYLKLEGYY